MSVETRMAEIVEQANSVSKVAVDVLRAVLKPIGKLADVLDRVECRIIQGPEMNSVWYIHAKTKHAPYLVELSEDFKEFRVFMEIEHGRIADPE